MRACNELAAAILGAGNKDTVALFSNHRVTYRALQEEVERWQVRLESAGVTAESSVLLQIAPSFGLIYALLAVWSLGAQACLLDHRVKDPERVRYVAQRQPAFCLTSVAPRASTFQAEREVKITYNALVTATRTSHALVQFSSGSTGHPKTVGRSASSLLAELERFASVPGWTTEGDVVLILNSLAHSFGLIGGLLYTLRVGATAAFAASALPRDLAAAVSAARPTAVLGVPAHFELLTRLPAGTLTNLRIAISSGQTMPLAIRDGFVSRHGLKVGDAYGSTEVGIVAVDATGELAPTVGKVVDAMQVSVHHDEVLVRADSSPYIAGDDDQRHQDGWFRTGDRGMLNEKTGTLTVFGRLDSVVVIGGLKVDLTEVESVLRHVPDVKDAIVVFNGTIEAYVEALTSNVTAAVLAHWCSVNLADVKIPRRFFVLAQLPRSATGKLIRRRDELERVRDQTQLFERASQ